MQNSYVLLYLLNIIYLLFIILHTRLNIINIAKKFYLLLLYITLDFI